MPSGSHIQFETIVAMLSGPKIPTPNPPGQGQGITAAREMPQKNWRAQFSSRRTGHGPGSCSSTTTASDRTSSSTVSSTSEAPLLYPVAESGKGVEGSTSDCGGANDDSPEIDTGSDSVYCFRDSLFVARSQFVKISTKHSAIWQADIRPRLRKDLMTTMERIHAKSRSKPAKESAVFLDLRMSGSAEKKASHVKLSVAIWVLCGSKWCMKLILSCIRDLDWLPYPGFGMEIHLGGPLPSASPGNSIERVLSFDTANFIPLSDGGKLWVHLEKPMPNNPCHGLLCSCIVEADGKREQCISKIGGMLTIKKTEDHELRYALTTAHGLFERLPQRSPIMDESDSEMESDSDWPQGESDSGSISTYQSDSAPLKVTSPVIGEVSALEQAEWMNVSDNFQAYFSQERIGGDLKLSPLPVSLEKPPQQRGSEPDFAIADPCCREHFQNDLNLGRSQTVMIKDIKEGMLSSPTTRVLLRPDESVIANIAPEEATYYLSGQERSVYKLELPSFLASGNSGSWAVRNGAFAGMVIANSEAEPIALMLPETQLKLSIAGSLGIEAMDISTSHDATAKQTPTGRALRDAELTDLGAAPEQTIQECRESLSVMAAQREKQIQDLINRLNKSPKAAMSDDKETTELATLQANLNSIRECISICSKADMESNKIINIIDNFATADDAIQVFISTNNEIIHAKTQIYGVRQRQLVGHLSDESLRQISRDKSPASARNTRDDSSLSHERDLWVSDDNDTAERSSVGFRA